MEIISSNSKELNLLKRFNNRDLKSFEEVYSLFYNELLHFALRLYNGTRIEASDVVQDVFISIWQSKKFQFENLISIKAYLYISIKNRFKNHIQHSYNKKKYEDILLNDDDSFAVNIIESEAYTLLSQAVDILPKECAEVLKMYVEGFDIKEIAETLNKSERTIYNRKYEAIDILRRRFKSDAFISLLLSSL